jgi:hypothetical protein
VEALEERALPSDLPLPLFVSAGSTFVGPQPGRMAVGHFTGDGNLDIAVITSNSVAVLLGDGHGKFTPAPTIQLDFTPGDIVAGNFTQHRQPLDDLVVTNTAGNSVYLLPSLGDGTFAQRGSFNTFSSGTGPTHLAVADFNHDTQPDLAVLDSDGTVSVLINNQAGGFSSLTSLNMVGNTGQTQTALAVGDFNGDGNMDIVTSSSRGALETSLNIMLGDGTGAFTGVGGGELPFTIPVATPVSAIVVGDFNGDGKADIATADFGTAAGGHTVSLRLGTGAVSFQPPVTVPVPVGGTLEFLAAADFNLDGKLDLITGSASTNNANNVTVLLGDGMGGFAGTLNFREFPLPGSVAVGDFNGDGRPDLAFGNPSESTVTVELNRPFLAEVGPPPGPMLINNGDILNLTQIARHLAKTGHHTPPGRTRLLLTLTNTSPDAVQGPLFLVVRGLSKHVHLQQAAGYLGLGSVFVDLEPGGGLNIWRPGDSLMVALDFFGLQNRHPHFALDLWAGTPH